MSWPLVSYIIPYYNAGNTIQETIDSILNQSYPNYDIWIVNDGSTDEKSIEKLKELENLDRVTVLHQENAGPSVARNLAIQRSSAKYILPLDADNTIIDDSLETFVKVAENNDRIDAVHGDFIYFGKKEGYHKRGPFNPFKSFMMSQIDTCALIKKSVFDRGISYDLFLSKPGLEDWEFWINFHSNGCASHYINEPLHMMRVDYSSRTYEVANKNIDRIKKYVYEKHAVALATHYERIYYQKKQLLETPDYRIGNFLMRPYRWVKKLIKK